MGAPETRKPHNGLKQSIRCRKLMHEGIATDTRDNILMDVNEEFDTKKLCCI
jgi:hypothetical protein